MAKYLICYDIRDPKRLIKLHNYLKRVALPLQYSLFLLEGNTKLKTQCMLSASKIINPKVDDLRCYVIADNLFQIRIGAPILATGIYFSSIPYQL